ncbi:tetratricopeptide repeat protein [Helicobacter burdigaliensis]|uniref:tetratricopeptide repeat protein n=1 Tax=Helicobacter burdigaliensis TaxID=2315334 RepID=UPI000EF71031|nr:tetratricopeptide repeat protein [Helicobacter burdigaliensis]
MKRLFFALFLGLGLVWAKINISVLDATIKDKALSGVELTFQKEGKDLNKAFTDNNGNAKIPMSFSKDDVMMILKKEGYASMAVKCPSEDFVYAMSPNLQTLDSMRVVLQWDNEPLDLDLHVYFKDSHIYFENKEGVDVNLDVENTEGYGPETITINKRHNGEKYIFFVHNYSSWAKEARDKEGKYALPLDKLKNAKVYVYVGSSLIRAYTMPPIPQGLKDARIWVPFYVDEEGKIIDKNIILDDENARKDDYFRKDLEKVIAKNFHLAYTQTISTEDKKQAKILDNLGVEAYKSKDYEVAIYHLKDSIRLNPNEAKSYSNLGLVYQKTGNLAEANWANRKAIELASGRRANTIKASSYYNIAKIYEEKGEYENALENYKKAQSHKANAVYTNAIKRMEDKLKFKENREF